MTITDRQLEIIEAAGRILTNEGVSGLTTKKLSKEMGFSEAAIYRHFDSKEKIIVAMLEYVAKMMDERYTFALSRNENTEQKFILIFQNKFTLFAQNPHFVTAVFSDGLLESSHLINQSIQKIMAVKIKHLKPIISEGQNNGVFTNVIATDDLLHIIMGGIRLLMYKWRVANFKFDIVKKGDELVNSLLNIIKS
ncbi:MAG: TetR/AcrR family transcriptional regulator [Saprospiraceae bacterium]|nr:TetR/AcrR family transcriptional regulator [Saprospiraceae bacterium]